METARQRPRAWRLGGRLKAITSIRLMGAWERLWEVLSRKEKSVARSFLWERVWLWGIQRTCICKTSQSKPGLNAPARRLRRWIRAVFTEAFSPGGTGDTP